MNNKKFVGMAAFAAMAMALAGCGSNTAASDDSKIVTDIKNNVTITFWNTMGGDAGKELQSMTKAFMKKNPKIKVVLQNQSNYSDLQQKVTTTLQSPKNLPTLTQAYSSWLTDGIKDGAVVNLDPYINSDNAKLKFDGWKTDILPGLMQDVQVDGKTYGIPFNKSVEVLWYNKTLFKELNLKVPTNWDEFAEVSQKITDAKGIPGAGFDSLANYYYTYLKDHGKEFTKKLDVQGKESKAALEYYAQGIKKGYFRIAGSDGYLTTPFASQKVGMYIGSTAGESFIKEGAQGKFEYAAAPYPGKYAIQQGTDIYMFSSATAEQRTAAYLYMKFLTEKNNQINWALKSGYIPVRKSAINDAEYAKSGAKVSAVLSDATKNLFIVPQTPGVQQADDDTYKFMEKYLADPSQSVDDALAQYKQTLDSDWE